MKHAKEKLIDALFTAVLVFIAVSVFRQAWYVDSPIAFATLIFASLAAGLTALAAVGYWVLHWYYSTQRKKLKGK